MRFHKGTDGWGRDSYPIPDFAVAGSSDCGTWADSPANSNTVKEELKALQDVLKEKGIKSRLSYTNSGNAFMKKRWVVVSGNDYGVARDIANKHLADTKASTRHIHDAV